MRDTASSILCKSQIFQLCIIIVNRWIYHIVMLKSRMQKLVSMCMVSSFCSIFLGGSWGVAMQHEQLQQKGEVRAEHGNVTMPHRVRNEL